MLPLVSTALSPMMLPIGKTVSGKFSVLWRERVGERIGSEKVSSQSSINHCDVCMGFVRQINEALY